MTCRLRSIRLLRLMNSMLFLFRSLLLLSCLTMGLAHAGFEEDDEVKQWTEAEVEFPPLSRQEDFLMVQVSAATDNQFFIDQATLSVGKDGVVRYVLLVLTQGGARNVSFEGIRCESREHRIYASGRPDGSWSKSRNNSWRRILDQYANRISAALFIDYFCPNGVIVRDAADARDALRRGGHPDTKRF